MEALLARTAGTLRGRFESLRHRGPVPSLMAETPAGHLSPHRETDSGPLPVFNFSALLNPYFVEVAAVVRDGKPTSRRDIWLGGDRSSGSDLLRICNEANGFVPSLRRYCGLPEDCGTRSATTRWLWTVFEVAERGVPGSLIGLVGGEVFRFADGVQAGETDISLARERPESLDSFTGALLRRDFGPTRYWQLADLVEASIMLMDIVEVELVSAAHKHAGPISATAVRQRNIRAPRGLTLAERLEADWSSEAGRRFLIGGKVREIAAHYGVVHGTLQGCRFWKEKIKPIRQKAERGSKAAKWRDRLSREGH